MKKINFNQKLHLNKSTVSILDADAQLRVNGGKKDEKTKTGAGVCTAMPTFACCDDTKTGPDVCTAAPTFACCDDTKTRDVRCK